MPPPKTISSIPFKPRIGAALGVALLVTAAASAVETTGRLKWFTSAAKLPNSDVLQAAAGDYFTDLHVDLRLLVKHEFGPVRLEFDPTVTLSGGDGAKLLTTGALPLDQLPGTDSDRYFDWSDELIGTDEYRVVTRIDRLSLNVRRPSWSLRMGRQAVSWGNGIVFQPLDLFSPFAPTTVDREFKPGVDSVLFEALVGDSSEVQALWIARQSQSPNQSSHTVAAKWNVGLGELAFDFIVAEHMRDEFAGLSVSMPVAGSLVRVDAARLCSVNECYVSGALNVDYTITVGPALIYLFAELYRNGFGLEDLANEPTPDLQNRLARGEVFTLMRNYGAVGANVTWHPLVSQSFVVIDNLDDGSGLLQSAVNYELNDSSRMQFGVSAPFGDANSEFGRHNVGPEATHGGNASLFVSYSRYF